MRKTLLAATILTTLAAGGIVAAQAPTPKGDEHAAHHPAKPTGADPAAVAKPGDAPATKAGGGTMGGGMMGGGMMGGGACPMMGHGPGGGMGAGMGMGMGMMGGMLGGAGTKVEVKKIDKGVTVTLTSADTATVARLQKMAEAMRLMHEATTQ